jgi:aminoglycoside phosphotransferase (APT) family kinase protein
VPGCAAGSATRLPGGENHAVYRVSCAARDVVVRVATSEWAREPAVAEREAAVLREVAGVAAPALYDFRCESEWFDAPVMCTAYVEGVARLPGEAWRAESLGRVVGRVHASPTDRLGGADAGGVRAYFDARVARLGWDGPLPPEVRERVPALLDRVGAHAGAARASGAFGAAEPLVLTHGDVAGGNVVWTPEPVLLDWEYARLGDPADEVAYVFAQHAWSAGPRELFWRGYRETCGRPVEPVAERAAWWEPVTMLGSALFWLRLWERGADARAATLERLAWCERLLPDP